MAADDSESWFESALRHAELAAHQIVRFRRPWWNPAWWDLVVPDDQPASHGAFTGAWGLRGKRSRPAVSFAISRFVKGDSAAACSPATPFNFGSGSGSGSGASSTSGGEEGSSSRDKAEAATGGKRRRVGDGGDVSATGGGWETMVAGLEKAPFSFRISAAKDISRRTGKKKTLCELQEEEHLLMEEKQQLEKEIVLKMKAYDKLWMENQTLKSRQVVSVPERAYKAAAARASSAVPSSSTGFFLPDLNEPLAENFN